MKTRFKWFRVTANCYTAHPLGTPGPRISVERNRSWRKLASPTPWRFVLFGEFFLHFREEFATMEEAQRAAERALVKLVQALSRTLFVRGVTDSMGRARKAKPPNEELR